MLQRAVWLLRDRLDPPSLVRLDDHAFVARLTALAAGTPAADFVAGLFGPTRRLLKRAASFDALRHPEVHRRLSGRTYAEARGLLAGEGKPVCMLFGTGWGMPRSILDACDRLLEPIASHASDYNHLSVRAAAAISLDRLRGAH